MFFIKILPFVTSQNSCNFELLQKKLTEVSQKLKKCAPCLNFGKKGLKARNNYIEGMFFLQNLTIFTYYNIRQEIEKLCVNKINNVKTWNFKMSVTQD